jgi:hypothetical protein
MPFSLRRSRVSSCHFAAFSTTGSPWQSEGQGPDPRQLHRKIREVGERLASPVFFSGRRGPFGAFGDLELDEAQVSFSLETLPRDLN